MFGPFEPVGSCDLIWFCHLKATGLFDMVGSFELVGSFDMVELNRYLI